MKRTRDICDTQCKCTPTYIRVRRIYGERRECSQEFKRQGRRCRETTTRVAIDWARPGREKDRDVRVFIGNWRRLRELTGAGLRETVGNPIKTNGLRKYFVSSSLSLSLALLPFPLFLFVHPSLFPFLSSSSTLYTQYSSEGSYKRLGPPIRRFSCIYTEYETSLLESAIWISMRQISRWSRSNGTDFSPLSIPSLLRAQRYFSRGLSYTEKLLLVV